MVTMSSEIFKIETGRFTLKPEKVKLFNLVTELVEEYKGIFAAGNFLTVVDCDEKLKPDDFDISGDPTMCYSVFHNLLRNAFEAAPEKSTITIRFIKNEQVEVLIENTGVVPEKIRDRFFDKFSTFGKSAGNGLGTYSAKLLLEAQGASIDMKTSDEDNLTCITARFSQSLPK
jgi:signal transduction histidine kinase